MICADRDIVLFNKRLDRESRREMYSPTKISGASVYEWTEATKDGTDRTEREVFKIRIPIDAAFQGDRKYLPAGQYDALSEEEAAEYWTLHNTDLIIIASAPFEDIDTAICEDGIAEPEIRALAGRIGSRPAPIILSGYADNTQRGSDTVKHWRLEGA